MKKHLLSQAAGLCLLGAMVAGPASGAPGDAVVAAQVPPHTIGLEVNADSGVAPGSQLRLTLEATAGGSATARIPGVDAAVTLEEVAPGQYSGHYTVRRTDRIDPAAVIRVSLTAAGRTAVASYTFPASFMAPVAIAPVQPVVIALAPIVVQPVPPPPVAVGTTVLAAPSAVLPLMVMSHQNNAMVGQDVTTIRGHTAPFATVNVRVDAISPPGRRLDAGVAQQLLSESALANANGDFSFDFNPRYVRDNASSLPVPGTRYEVSITAIRDNLSTESRLMLFQRG